MTSQTKSIEWVCVTPAVLDELALLGWEELCALAHYHDCRLSITHLAQAESEARADDELAGCEFEPIADRVSNGREELAEAHNG